MRPDGSRSYILDACRSLLDRMLSRIRLEVCLDGLELSPQEIDEQLRWGR